MLDLTSCADGHTCPKRGRCERWVQRATCQSRTYENFNARRTVGGICDSFVASVPPMPFIPTETAS